MTEPDLFDQWIMCPADETFQEFVERVTIEDEQRKARHERRVAMFGERRARELALAIPDGMEGTETAAYIEQRYAEMWRWTDMIETNILDGRQYATAAAPHAATMKLGRKMLRRVS